MGQEKVTVDEKPTVAPDDGESTLTPFQGYMRIFRYATPKERALQAVAVACALAAGVGMAMLTLVFGLFITAIANYTSGNSSPQEFRNAASQLSLYLFLIGLVRFIVSYGYGTLLTLTAYRITKKIREQYVKAGLRQEIAFFDAGTGGSVAMQATSNGKLIQGGISEKLGLVFQALSAFVACFILALVTHWKLTLICCCIAPATLLVSGASGAREAAIETKILQIQGQGGAFAESAMSSARTVHAFGLRERLVAQYDKFLVEAHRHGRKKNIVFGLLFSSEYFITFAGSGLCFWQGVGMLARGEVEEPGDVFTVLLAVILGSVSLTSITPYLIDFSRSASAAAELFRLMDRTSNIDPLDPSGEQPTDVIGDIEMRNVTFSYPMRPGVTVLDNFSLHIPAGKITALVGQSGSGKSTIIGLLERWYNCNSGSVLIDGRPVEKLNLAWLRKQVRLVQQEPILFAGTIFDNIATGLIGTRWENSPRSEQLDRITEAAKVAFAHDFIMELPDGYDTVIGERGGLLSGGQKQRVAIARSVVSQPPILLLDEATSALDPHAEDVVQQALDNVSQGRTTITIAHKLATIRKADNIVVMQSGRIIEQGTHSSLLDSNGAYARLVKAQDLSSGIMEGDQSGNDTAQQSSSESDVDVPAGNDDDLAITKSVTRMSTTAKEHAMTGLERDNYDKWKRLGLLHTVWRLVTSSPELKWAYVMLVLACVLSAASYPAQAVLMSKFIGVFKYSGAEMQRRGNFFALMYLAIACGCLVVYFVMGWFSNVVATTLNHKYRKQLANDILRQDMQFFDRPENTAGALASRLDSYPQAIFELMGFNIALILICTLGVVSCAVLALAYGWQIGVVIVLAGLPPLLGSGYARIRLEAKMDAQTSKRFSASASIASEAITAIRTVSSLAMEQSVLDKYSVELQHANADSTKTVLLVMLAFAFTQSVEFLFQALGFWYGCRLVSFGQLDMTSFLTAFLAVFFSGQEASILFGFSSSMTKGTNASNYIFWLEQLEPTIKETEENRCIGPQGFKTFDLDNVQFNYPMRPKIRVLRGVDLQIKQGQFVAFVGASGCGKSTMISMLQRFYDPIQGRLIPDGRPLNEMNPWLYRSQVALVQQEPKLYPGSIRENISMGVVTNNNNSDDPSSSSSVPVLEEEEIINACRQANAWDFISSLPQGLDTPCGTSGLQLSGGQRQRIAIARALIRNPALLLLDEATSALDTQSERIVQEALSEAAASGNRITIAVAHRLSTVRHADKICVFHGGRIADAGTHDELLARCDMYRKMCEAQNLEG